MWRRRSGSGRKAPYRPVYGYSTSCSNGASASTSTNSGVDKNRRRLTVSVRAAKMFLDDAGDQVGLIRGKEVTITSVGISKERGLIARTECCRLSGLLVIDDDSRTNSDQTTVNRKSGDRMIWAQHRTSGQNKIDSHRRIEGHRTRAADR